MWKCGATRGRLCPNHPDASFSLDRGNYTAVRLLGPVYMGVAPAVTETVTV